MIGNTAINYRTQDLVSLVRRDIIDKFGQRDLQGIDLTVPAVYGTKAKVVHYPDPKVTITSVAEQIANMNLPQKPQVPRAADSINRDHDRIGGDDINFHFDLKKRQARFTGGYVAWVDQRGSFPDGHFVSLLIDFPLGINYREDTIVPYSINDRPCFFIMTQAMINDRQVQVFLDAAMTSNIVTVSWDDQFEAEDIEILIESKLERTNVLKVPALPTEPIIEWHFEPEGVFVPAEIEMHIDLAKGR
jgi:hypothetical protein